jgi:hypothetical protein
MYILYIYNTYNIQMLIWNPCRSYQFLHLFLSQSINIPRAAYTGYVPSHKCSTICLEPHARKTKSQLAPLAASASQFGPTKAFLTRGDRADDRNVWDLMMISSIYRDMDIHIHMWGLHRLDIMYISPSTHWLSNPWPTLCRRGWEGENKKIPEIMIILKHWGEWGMYSRSLYGGSTENPCFKA